MVRLSGKNVYLREVKTEVSFLSGIESEITSALFRHMGRRGVKFTTKCPELIVDLISVNHDDYYYTPSGFIDRISGSARYKVIIYPCRGKHFSRVISIPISYSYYSRPYQTEASMRSSIINGVDKLSEKIMEILNGYSVSYQ